MKKTYTNPTSPNILKSEWAEKMSKKSDDKQKQSTPKKSDDKKKETRIQAKYVHVTLHNLEVQDIGYWLKKGMEFRANSVACLVGLEENVAEGKGVHAHIVIQFGTKQKLSRKNFVDHFGSDSLHIATKPNKDALLTALGYVSKTGNTKQLGIFTHRSVELECSPEVYRFQYMVKTADDGLKYFTKIINEHIKTDKNIIKKFAKRKDAIGRWLQKNRQHTTTLHRLAQAWYLDSMNETKTGFKFQGFCSSAESLKLEYQKYLDVYPDTFTKYKRPQHEIDLEDDYADHADHDVHVLRQIIETLGYAIQFGSHRPTKYLNLYLWSTAPSFGKTRLLNFLDEHMLAYRLPDDQYYVDYENGLYQLLVNDEATSFLRSKDYSHLRLILEGERVEFNLKGREKVYKEDNPLIILAENVSFNTCMSDYHAKRYDASVMASRILDLQIRSRATLHFFIDKCVIPNPKKKEEQNEPTITQNKPATNPR